MNAGGYALGLALVAGSVRALVLWRASTGVDVVNVVVLKAFAEGRARDLPALLRGSGAALYLEVARAIGHSLLELLASSEEKLRERLLRDANAAVFAASRQLRRHAWLDAVAIASIVFAGLNAAINASASGFETLGLAAATLLFFANVRGSRSIATRMYAGAIALVDSLIAGLEPI